MGNILTTGAWTNRIFIWAALGILLFFLLSEHLAHLLGALPWLLLAACVLLHRFMHGTHDDNEDHRQGSDHE